MILKIYDSTQKPSPFEKEKLINFLFKSLEQYGDPKYQIEHCLNYALKEVESFGGMAIVIEENNKILAATIINKTGMGGYIPENILVYIATDKKQRGKGLGKKLIRAVIENTQGDIALHVEKDNPAKYLYEKVGFTNPYLEMRLKR